MFGDLKHAGDMLKRNALKFRDEEALVYEDTRLSWRQLNARANQFAHALRHMGFKPGDLIAIYSDNNNQYVEAIFGAAKLGVAVANINYRLIASEAEYIIRDSNSKALVFSTDFSDEVQEMRKRLKGDIDKYIGIGAKGDWYLEYESVISEMPEDELELESPIEDEAPWLIIYTSGTTGFPKGGVWWHKGTIINSYNFAYTIGIRYGMKLLLPAPLYATAGAIMMSSTMNVGASGIIVNFEAESVLKTIEREKPDYANFVPATLNFLINHPKFQDYDLSSLKTILYAGSVMPVPLLKKAMQNLKCDLRQVFGMTETCAAGTVLEPWEHVLEGEEKWTKRLGSCGRPSTHIEARVVDENDNDVAIDEEIGELIIKSDGNIKYYLNNPEGTKEAIKNGWVYTGDLCTIDQDGFIYVVDRKKDMIVSAAMNIYPTEIEHILYGHDAVLECAVIGVPDEKWGEAVKAIVVLKDGADATEEDIIDFCRSKMAGYKKPKSVDFVDSLPRNLAGKVLKKDLREPYWKGYDRKV